MERILTLIEKWNNHHCAYCEPGTLVSIEGMTEFKCIHCGKAMTDRIYLEEIQKIVGEYIVMHEEKRDEGRKDD